MIGVFEERCFVDGGYIGDTVIQYSKIFGKQQKIYVFEPDQANYIQRIENT